MLLNRFPVYLVIIVSLISCTPVIQEAYSSLFVSEDQINLMAEKVKQVIILVTKDCEELNEHLKTSSKSLDWLEVEELSNLVTMDNPTKSQIVTVVCFISAAIILSQGQSLSKNGAKKDLDCTSNRGKMDECGLAQGFSFIYDEYAYPTNHSALLKSCKRQAESFKCLKQNSKCLSPLSRQVLSAIIAGRIKYNKRLCADTVTDFNGKFIDTFKCMSKVKALIEKGQKAELFAAVVSEGIANTKLNSSDIRLKHACCAVSEIKRQYIDSTRPNCAIHSGAVADLIDSYLADSISIICPDFDKGMTFCDKLPKLNVSKEAKSKFFILPVLDVVQLLAD